MADATDKKGKTNGNGAVADAPAAAPVGEDTTRSYRVFEAAGVALKPGDTVTYLGDFDAPDKALARWAAVDASPERQAAAQVDEGSKDGGLFLIAVPARNSTPERTYEEVVRTSIRR